MSESSKPVKIDIDFARASQLLSVVKEVAGVAPGFTSLSSEAMAELKEMNDKIAEAATKRTEAKRADLAAKGTTEVSGQPVDSVESTTAASAAPKEDPAPSKRKPY